MSLSFLDGLNDEQLKYARIIGERAKAIGVDPALAISIAYQESRLNPNVKDSSAGAMGIMQVMPSTAAGLNVDKDALKSIDANINVGLKVLKLALNSAGGDPVKAAIAYNAGPGTLKSYENNERDLPQETRNYISSLHQYGTFGDRPLPMSVSADVASPPENAASAPPPGPVARAKEVIGQGIDELGLSPGEVGGLVGGGIGLMERKGMGPASIMEKGMAGARQALPPPPAGALPSAPSGLFGGTPGTTPGTSPGTPMATPSGPLDAGRMARGQTGVMPYNYGKAAGLTDIEAGRALDMTKQTGGVHDLTTQRREALQRLQSMFPGERYIENPRYGGIMTPDQGAGGGPRASFVERAPEVSPGQPPQPKQLAPVPLRQPIPTGPKPMGALEEVTQMLRNMAEKGLQVSRGVGGFARALPMASYPLAGYAVGSELGNISEELQKDRPDYADIVLGGAGALGTALSMHPLTAPVGVPMAIGAPAVRYLRGKREPIGPVPSERQIPGLLPIEKGYPYPESGFTLP